MHIQENFSIFAEKYKVMDNNQEIRNIHGIDVIVIKDRNNGCEECVFANSYYCNNAANHTEEVCGEEMIGRNHHFERAEQQNK